jgi:GT2 family glycosyltransferase
MLNMSIAIVILNFNGRKFLEKFLPKVIAHSPEGEIYVADNCSTDDSVAYLKENYPSIKRISMDKNRGYAGGYNHALKEIQADYFVLMNSDIEPKENWLAPLIQYFKENPTTAAVQPFIMKYDQPDFFEYAGAAGGLIDYLGYPFCRGRIFDTLEKNNDQYPTAKIHWATGACLMVNATKYWEVGGLDDYFFAHQEEIDLCWRFRRAGYDCAAISESQVLHVGGGTLDQENPFKTYLNFRNNLILLHKNLPPNQKFKIITLRLILDGIAGIKFALNFKFNHTWAIIKAHGGYYSYLLFHPKKKQNSHQMKNVALFEKSIIYNYFIKGKKTFKELD